MEDPSILRRYTNLPSLIYLLREKKITLLNPETWDDYNDVYYLKKYKEKRELKTLLALCLTQTNETYHHWKVFADGHSGVRIDFKKDHFLNHFSGVVGVHSGPVKYGLVKEQQERANTGGIKITDLPFTKRWSYGDEKEFRILYESKTEEKTCLDLTIELSCIDMIELSPWMPSSLFEAVKATLQIIDGCQNIKIRRSTVVGHNKWQSYANKAS